VILAHAAHRKAGSPSYGREHDSDSSEHRASEPATHKHMSGMDVETVTLEAVGTAFQKTAL
jgi:hypothetical protein